MPRPKKEEPKKEESKEVLKKSRKKAKPPTTEIKTNAMVKKVKDLDKELLVFRCTKKSRFMKSECGNPHFRHAGYMEAIVPYMKPTKEGQISTSSLEVKVCTVCKSCYVYVDNHFYNVTDDIKLDAWEETEKEMQKATGPGGQC